MGLSPRQIEVARLLAQGHSQEQAGKAVGASRRTVSRWLQSEDFRNMSYASVGRVAQAPPQRPPERRKQASKLTPQDLVQDALEAVRGILTDPDSRNCDRLKAAALVGQWSGLGEKNKMLEIEAVKILIDSNWVGTEAIDAAVDGVVELEEKMRNVLGNGHKKSPPQIYEEGVFDDELDDEDE